MRTYSETPRRIDEASDQNVETTRDRVKHSHLTESEDDVEHHDTDDKVAENKTKGTTTVESTTGTDEETSTNGTTDGNHVQVATLHGLVELVVTVLVGLLTTLERLRSETHTSPEGEQIGR